MWAGGSETRTHGAQGTVPRRRSERKWPLPYQPHVKAVRGLSGFAGSLEDRYLVTRQTGSQDARRTLVELTQAGQLVLERVDVSSGT